MTSPKDRLKEYLSFKRISIREFERMCGLSNGLAMRLGTTTNPATLRKISEYCDLNIDWLLHGEGQMLKDKPETKDLESNNAFLPLRIPLIPASAFAGKVNGFAPESVSLDKCETIISLVPGADMAIPITGDSMEPDYPDGSLAYIKRINEVAFIPWGHTVVLDTENGAFIKRIYPDIDDDGYVWGKSINPDYPPMHIPKSSIFRIFRVLGTSRVFTTM